MRATTMPYNGRKVYDMTTNTNTPPNGAQGAVQSHYGERACERCGQAFEPRRSNARFCSRRCQNGQSVVLPGPQKHKGAISELRVCADLLTKGYEVFRNVSQHGTCDLVAMRDGQLYRVAVKSGVETKHGRVYHGGADPSEWDILAVTLVASIAYKGGAE